jgi:Flp pilus assembly protein TadG
MRNILNNSLLTARRWRIARRLAQDTRGVSAVEFALILPIMITMYIGAVEFSHALTVDRRVTSVASAAADLVAQSKQTSSAQVLDVFTAANSIMQPYSSTPISIVLTSVVADVDNKTTVDWSCAHNGSAYADDAAYILPDGLTQPFSSIIVAEVSYSYTPPVGEFITGSINLTQKFFLRPRRSLTVEWDGAPC